MVTRNPEKRPRRAFVITYPGKPEAVVHLVIENLQKAQKGRRNMRDSIMLQYKKRAGIDTNLNLKWDRLDFETEAAREARLSKSQ